MNSSQKLGGLRESPWNLLTKNTQSCFWMKPPVMSLSLRLWRPWWSWSPFSLYPSPLMASFQRSRTPPAARTASTFVPKTSPWQLAMKNQVPETTIPASRTVCFSNCFPSSVRGVLSVTRNWCQSPTIDAKPAAGAFEMHRARKSCT